MTRDEVKEVFKILANVYQSFEVSTEKLDTWFEFLKDQERSNVMKNVKRFVLESRYPPTIADIIEKRIEAYQNSIFNQIREWEAHAARKQ